MRTESRVQSTHRLNAIGFLTGLLTLVACGLYWWQMETSHEALRAERMAQTETRASQIANVTGEQISAIARGADFALLQLRHAYSDDRVHFDATARSILDAFPQGSLIHVAVIGADGYIAYSTLGLPKEPIYAGDREHFKVHLSGKDQLEVSPPIYGRASKAWTFLFTRPIHERGKFIGVAVVSMSPAYISGELARLEMSSNDVIALIHADGSYLAHNLNWQQALGKSVAKDRPYLRPDSPARGIMHAPGSMDSAPRIIAWQRLGTAGLVVGVAIDEQAVVAPLQALYQKSRLSAFAVIGFMLVLGGGICALLLHVATQGRKLDEGQTKYRQLYEAMTDAYVLVDMKGRIVDSNRAYQELLGYTPEELSRLTYMDVTPARWREAEDRIVEQQIIPRGSSEVYEKSYIRKDGSEFPIELRTYLLRDSAGQARGMWAIVRDITERQQIQAALQRERDHLRQILDSHFGMFAVLALDGVIVEVNRTPLDLMGLQRAEVLGRRIWDVGWLQGDAVSQVQTSIQVAASGEPVRSEVVVHFTGLGPRNIDAVFSPLRSADGRAVNVVAFGIDITDRKRAEERVRAALAEKEVLIKEIYHRVKNNMQVVSSLLNMQGRSVADPDMKALLAESANRVKSMALVHEQLYRSGDLSNIALADYLAQLADHLQQGHLPLSARVPVRLEVAQVTLGIETAVPLGLIVNELVSNAYKHGYAEDAARGEIVLRVEQLADGALRLEVSDDGSGLPAGFDATSVASLGMQLVVTLTAQLGGTLRHRAEDGRTIFEIVFSPEAREAQRLVV